MTKETDKSKDDKKKSRSKVKKTKTDKQVADLKKKNETLQNEINELKDKLLRTAAEFENYKKRSDRERLGWIQNANESLVTELLNVVDDMERSMQHMDEKNDFEALKNGFELIYKNLFSTLEKQGLKAMEVIGEQFDPEKHDALMQMEKKDVESGTILDQHKKGYVLNEKIIRHAQVIVAK